MPKGTNVCNNFLALLYNGTTWANVAINATASPITDIYMALANVTGAPGDTMSTSETAYTNYVRQTIVRSTLGFTAPSGAATSNAAAVNYPQCGVTGDTIVAAKLGKAAGASDVFHYGDLNSPVAVSNNIRLTFDIGDITITEA